MIANDKIMHLIAGGIAGLFGCMIHPAAGVLAAFVAGIGKEIYDRFTDGLFDWRDVWATALGGAVVNLIFALYLLLGV